MSNRTALLLAPTCLLISSCFSGSRVAGDFKIQIRKGEFLREDYIHSLCETLSPLRATRPDDAPQMIIVDRDGRGLTFMPIHNFHEGDNLFRLAADRHLRQAKDEGGSDLGELLHGASTQEFHLKVGQQVLRFRYVGDAERWVSTAVLAGTYRDADGRSFVFGEDGIAEFPEGPRFKYSLGIDHILNSYDYIDNEGTNQSWAVDLSATKLELRNVNDDQQPVETSRWVLQRVTPPRCQ
jgi:hypothetical protein